MGQLPSRAAAVLTLILAAVPLSAAEGQTWFDNLFPSYGAPPQARPAVRPVYRPPTRPRPRVAARPPERMADRPPEKLGKEVTFVTAVVGDSLGQLLGLGLADVLADRPEVGVLRRAREDTGLTRDDVFDWVKGTRDLLGGTDKVGAAVMFIGSNDRQPLRDGDGVQEPFTPRWTEIYRARVAAVDAEFKNRHVPLIWVGLPVVRSDRLAADFAKLNDIYREEAAKGGATFVDVWEAFADEHGRYSPVGPGTDGQVVRLRTADGVHFTRAGTLKLAHFIEGDIRRDLPSTTTVAPQPAPAPAAAPLGRETTPAPAAALPVPQPKPAAGPVLSLTGPPAAADGLLVQRGGAKTSAPLVDAVLVHGRAPDRQSRELAR